MSKNPNLGMPGAANDEQLDPATNRLNQILNDPKTRVSLHGPARSSAYGNAGRVSQISRGQRLLQNMKTAGAASALLYGVGVGLPQLLTGDPLPSLPEIAMEVGADNQAPKVTVKGDLHGNITIAPNRSSAALAAPLINVHDQAYHAAYLTLWSLRDPQQYAGTVQNYLAQLVGAGEDPQLAVRLSNLVTSLYKPEDLRKLPPEALTRIASTMAEQTVQGALSRQVVVPTPGPALH